jgi:hypothetical protein
LNYLHTLAERLNASQNLLVSENASNLNSYINKELVRRLGVMKAHLAQLSKKEPFFDPQVYAIKKSSRCRIFKPKQRNRKISLSLKRRNLRVAVFI